MTPTEMDATALNLAVAESVMGATWEEQWSGWRVLRPAPDGHTWRLIATQPPGHPVRYQGPAYSSDPTALPDLLDVLAKAGLGVVLDIEGARTALLIREEDAGRLGRAWVDGPPSTAWPLALCRAAIDPAVIEHMRLWRESQAATPTNGDET
jgi:hypothetical protein